MSKGTEKSSFFEKLATVIVDKRNLIFFLYACALIFCLFSRNWVSVCNDITEYLPETTETRQGLTLMEEEFTTFGTARVMVSHVTYEIAEELAEQMEQIEGVTSATFGSSTVGADTGGDGEPETPEDITEYFKGADALISVTFDGEEEDEISLAALAAIRELLEPYDYYIDSAVGNSQADSLASEMGTILAVAAVIIVLVLLLTSRSYAEIPVLLITFIVAALLNLGTNFIFGEISFVSNSVTVVLQLALAIDYAIIMLHRFLEEREYAEDREACIAAVSAAIPSISASSLTTISGLAAMMFMQFRIGFDMGIILIKAILFSMLSVFTLMPGLLMLFSKAMAKTQHRSFVPKIDRWGKFTLKLRYVGVPLFAAAIVAGFLMSNQCPYVYGYSQIQTARQNETQIAEKKVNETFGTQNVMALIVPKGDYISEKALLERLETYDQVDYAMGLSNVEVMDGYMLTDALTPRQFAEMTDLDYELVCLVYAAYAAEGEEYGRIVGGLDDYTVPLMDMFFFAYDKVEEGYVDLDEEEQADLDALYEQLSDAREQLLGEDYTRMLVSLDLPEEGEETFAFLQTIHDEAERYYDAENVYLVGDSTSDYDLSVSFARDNVMISVLSVAFVIIVLLFTFQSVGLPLLLILVIQGSIWISFSFPGVTQQPIFFMSYLVVSSIQMGANIDYAIVVANRYQELKEEMDHRDAIIETMNFAFPTIITSGTILAVAGTLIGMMTSTPSITGIGQNLGRGTIISIILVMFVLPQILLIGGRVVDKTSFSMPNVSKKRTGHGRVRVDGIVHGEIKGIVSGIMHATVDGDVELNLISGAASEEGDKDETE